MIVNVERWSGQDVEQCMVFPPRQQGRGVRDGYSCRSDITSERSRMPLIRDVKLVAAAFVF